MNDTPIYRDMIIEAKRRTKRNSLERSVLVEMDKRTVPKERRISPIAVNSHPVPHHRTLGPAPTGFQLHSLAPKNTEKGVI